MVSSDSEDDRKDKNKIKNKAKPKSRSISSSSSRSRSRSHSKHHKSHHHRKHSESKQTQQKAVFGGPFQVTPSATNVMSPPSNPSSAHKISTPSAQQNYDAPVPLYPQDEMIPQAPSRLAAAAPQPTVNIPQLLNPGDVPPPSRIMGVRPSHRGNFEYAVEWTKKGDIPLIACKNSQEMRRSYSDFLIDYLEKHIVLKKSDIPIPHVGHGKPKSTKPITQQMQYEESSIKHPDDPIFPSNIQEPIIQPKSEFQGEFRTGVISGNVPININTGPIEEEMIPMSRQEDYKTDPNEARVQQQVQQTVQQQLNQMLEASKKVESSVKDKLSGSPAKQPQNVSPEKSQNNGGVQATITAATVATIASEKIQKQ